MNCSLAGFNIWGIAVNSTKGNEFFQQVLDTKSKVTLEDAIFGSEQAFKPANLQDHLQFWEEEILKDHPPQNNLLGWVKGVKIEEFLKYYTSTKFQGIKLNSYYPHTQSFPNYVLWTTQWKNGHLWAFCKNVKSSDT